MNAQIMKTDIEHYDAASQVPQESDYSKSN